MRSFLVDKFTSELGSCVHTQAHGTQSFRTPHTIEHPRDTRVLNKGEPAAGNPYRVDDQAEPGTDETFGSSASSYGGAPSIRWLLHPKHGEQAGFRTNGRSLAFNPTSRIRQPPSLACLLSMVAGRQPTFVRAFGIDDEGDVDEAHPRGEVRQVGDVAYAEGAPIELRRQR